MDDINNQIENTHGMSKPSYDGRIHFYNRLNSYMQLISFHSFNRDYFGWYKALRGYFSLVQPYISSKNIDKLKIKITKTKENINRCFDIRGTRQNKDMVLLVLNDELQDLTDDMYMYSRHMLVPIKIDEDIEFDDHSFDQGSDI